jgi:hypothetical protein
MTACDSPVVLHLGILPIGAVAATPELSLPVPGSAVSVRCARSRKKHSMRGADPCS